MRGAAETAMERCDLLADVSEETGVIVRPYGSPSMRKVNEIVAGWMRDSGMSVRRDGIGNLIGVYEGTRDKTLILGSHLDTVRDAGKYDGILGVMVALACVRRLHDQNEHLPFAIEIVAFADEGGLRFGTTFLGSSVYAGDLDPALLELTDNAGVTLADAVREFGGDPDSLRSEGRDSEGLIGYCEVHIEQGPTLEELDLPVGVVSAITGQSRVSVSFTGGAGHAGTVPMRGRKDALCAAAELVLEAERAAREEPGSVATVGEIAVFPGASNVIPGEARLSLDIRHGDDATRGRLRDHLEAQTHGIAESRDCGYEWQPRQETPAVPTDPRLSATLERAVENSGVAAHRLPSGAGHDAAQLAALAPVAMLFVRCKDGISHNPEESVKEEDVDVAIDVLGEFLRLLVEERSTLGRDA